MLKIKVTEALIRLIKEQRTREELSARQLSERLKKSISYVSALECKKIEYIDSDMFLNIFAAISDDYELTNEFMDNLIKNFILTTTLDIDLDNEKWILQYYLFMREQEMHPTLISFIFNTLDDLDISYEDFTKRINENRHLAIDNIPENQLSVFCKNRELTWFYKIKIDANFIEDIFMNKIQKTNYIYLYIIIYSLLTFTETDPGELDKETFKWLYSYNFYKLHEVVGNLLISNIPQYKKTTKPSSNQNQNLYITKTTDEFFDKRLELENEIETLKNSFDSIKNINDSFDYYIKVLNTINKNITTDFNFLLALASISLDNFDKIGFEKKQKVIKCIDDFLTNHLNEIK